jgi:Zn-dependent peptidase ImmA (M78 family)
LNPEKAREFTISHELQHILTREKAVDIRAMSRSPALITDEPSYLDLPEEVVENLSEYRQLLHEIAVDVLSKANELPVAKEFEKRVRERV